MASQGCLNVQVMFLSPDFPKESMWDYELVSIHSHVDVIKWKHFPHYWPFVPGIHQSQVNSRHKGQWRGALICARINNWVNNGEACDLRRHGTHHDLTVMFCSSIHITDAVPPKPIEQSPVWPQVIIWTNDDLHIFFIFMMTWLRKLWCFLW